MYKGCNYLRYSSIVSSILGILVYQLLNIFLYTYYLLQKIFLSSFFFLRQGCCVPQAGSELKRVILFLIAYFHMYLYVWQMSVVLEEAREPDPLQLEVVGRHRSWVLRTAVRASVRTVPDFNCWTICLVPGFEHLIVLSQTLKCWDWRHISPWLAHISMFFTWKLLLNHIKFKLGI